MKNTGVVSMSPDKFIAYLSDLDIHIQCDGDNLRCNAPEGALTPSLRAELAKRKPEILCHLRQSRPEPLAGEPPESASANLFMLSPPQKRLWLLAQQSSTTEMHHIPTAFRLKGALDVAALRKTVDEVQRRHGILRTTFVLDGVEPKALVRPSADLEWIRVDLRDCPDDVRETKARKHIREMTRNSFDLENGPLWRAGLVTMEDEDQILLFVMHHIIFDGWSKKILNREIQILYRSFTEDDNTVLTNNTHQYPSYAARLNRWLSSPDGDRQIAYWKHHLDRPAADLTLPATRSRPATQTFRGGTFSFHLPSDLEQSLCDFSSTYKVTLFITLMAAYNILLNRYTGQEDLVICTPVHCRNSTEWEETIGPFNNIVVVRTDLSNDPSLEKILNRTREVVINAYKHQEVPIQIVSSFPHLVRTTLTRSMFSLRNTLYHTMSLPDIYTEKLDVRKLTADFDMALYMEHGKNSLRGTIEYNKDVFDRPTIEELAVNFRKALEVLISHPKRRLSGVPRLGKSLVDVESALRSHPQVEDAVVVSPHDNKLLNKVVAYIVPNQYDIPTHRDLLLYLKKDFPEYILPAAFAPVDGFMFDSSGEIDRSALPLPSNERGDNGYVAPRTELEQALVKIWTRVLWLDSDIGIRDNFFDLGGHSLLSVQLFCEVERYLGHKLTSQSLHSLSTVEELAKSLQTEAHAQTQEVTVLDKTVSGRVAALLEDSRLPHDIYEGLLAHTSGWEGQRAAVDSLVVGLNTNGSGLPLFWVFQGFREMRQLSMYLGLEQPIYGMRSGHRLMERTNENEDSLAAYYTGEILSLQPDGPFLVGGNCQAAIIAFKIAKRLMQRGRQVSLLCLQERFIPENYPGRTVLLYGNDSSRNPFHYFNQPSDTWQKFYTGPLSVHFIEGRHGEFFKEPNINTLAERLKEEIRLAQAETNVPDIYDTVHPALPVSGHKAEIRALSEITVGPDETVSIRVKVYNAGDQTWPGNAGARITLGYRLKDPTGKFDISTDPGAPLPPDLHPGSHCELDLKIRTPLVKGSYRLELDMLESGTFWFKNAGSHPAEVIVLVHSKWKILNGIWDVLRKAKRLLARI